MTKVLMLASGLSAREIENYDYKANGWAIVAINNGWVAYENWDHWVHSDDFMGNRPESIKPNQTVCKQYGTILRHYGGHKNCGYSITLCAAYYALRIIKPKVIGFLGADMNYVPDRDGKTHIYGVGYDIIKNGIPDPDRMVEKYSKDNTTYLHDIYMRFHGIAKDNGCEVYNFSSMVNTRLPYPKSKPSVFG